MWKEVEGQVGIIPPLNLGLSTTRSPSRTPQIASKNKVISPGMETKMRSRHGLRLNEMFGLREDCGRKEDRFVDPLGLSR